MNETFAKDAFLGKCVFITGATRGIGLEIAKAFIESGAFVIGTAIDETSREALAQTLGDKGAAVIANVTDPELPQALDAQLSDLPFVDIVVNNAGITRDTLALRMKDEDFESVLSTNLTGAFRVARYFMRPMMKARSGRIINMASVVGLTGNAGQANYSASKAGLIAMTKTLAQELGPRGITVNAVAPGFIDTAMTQALPPEIQEKILKSIPLARYGTTRDVANAVLFLASDAAAYISGVTLTVSGALVCH
ncbi:MAG TPA: 3-oxoacyl-ACP reductase [Sutterella sp.]|nr:3-oxoacyl-ACP reductase [Sutterella sp.]